MTLSDKLLACFRPSRFRLHEVELRTSLLRAALPAATWQMGCRAWPASVPLPPNTEG